MDQDLETISISLASINQKGSAYRICHPEALIVHPFHEYKPLIEAKILLQNIFKEQYRSRLINDFVAGGTIFMISGTEPVLN